MNRQADGKRRKEIQPSSPAIERGCEKDSRGQIGRTKKKKEEKRTREKSKKERGFANRRWESPQENKGPPLR